MNIEYVGRRVDLKDAFYAKTEKRVAKLDKFFSDAAHTHVTVTVDKGIQTVEVTIRDGGFVVRAEKSAEKMENALEVAFDVITTQIIKNKRRLEQRLHSGDFDEFMNDEIAHKEDDFEVIREKRFSMKPCTVEEAILQMNLLGHSFYMFLNADSGSVEVCYRRHDGGYGVLIPELD